MNFYSYDFNIFSKCQRIHGLLPLLLYLGISRQKLYTSKHNLYLHVYYLCLGLLHHNNIYTVVALFMQSPYWKTS